ncbi:MocR-like pyridoxine biosynthesis transcription factor PdxR [Neobacillus dielmonensis]|uniref:MocR-like pyridoxine biosynthesis transcription factor PdxR n=1 Tax=Neobacillus dielmonensis TaxID=1347369 RepID=UPI0005A9DE68|nr:PLP-dependent aminotransferase family protein [Neobacillus dielmonensis]
MIEITPVLDPSSRVPLYMQLSDYIKSEILSGRIRPQEKLPSKRHLANYLGLSLNTIQAAYDQLNAEGFVKSRPRQGLFVAELEDEFFKTEDTPHLEIETPFIKSDEIKIDFNSGRVDLAQFPYAAWRKLTIQSLYEDQAGIFYNGEPQGERNLREEIAKHLFASRGVKCTAKQIIIGAGTQYLIGILVLLLGNGTVYALEEPGFHRARTVLDHHDVPHVPIPLDEAGMDIGALQKSAATVAYVTPSHQFPMGMVMPTARRQELLNWAEVVNGFIIEDDYDGEYRYKGVPIPSLQGLDANGRVIYLGTFSKSLIPSIRISYLVLPPALLKIYQNRFTIYKQTTSRLHQETLFRFMSEGYWQSHLNKMRTLYRRKHEVLLAAIDQLLGEQVEMIGEKSGLHIVLAVKSNMSEDELILAARRVGVKIYPSSLYYTHHTEQEVPKVVIGFGGLTESEIEEGIYLLKKAWGI